MNKKQQLSPIPPQWLKSLSIRPPDFRALIATWVDPVVRRKGLSIYEEMLLDPQVYASINLLKFATLSLEFTVAPRDDQKGAKADAISEEVQMMLESFPGGLMEFLYNTLSALDYGWSITELIWTANKDKKWVPGKWVALPQSLYGFDIDETTGEPSAVKTWFAPMTKGQTWPLDNFFILRWNSRFGSPYGRSQLLSTYEAWWVKQLLKRMRNTTLDRFGTPLIIARVPKKFDENKRDELGSFIANLYAESGLIVDEDVSIEMPHQGAGQGAAQGFQAAIEYEDSQIAKGITGVTLNSNESRGTGTYAQARVHQDNFLYWVRRVSRMLEENIQRQIIDRYCRYNHGLDPEDTPVIRFATPESDNLNELVTTFVQAAGIGLVNPQDEDDKAWMRERLNFPAASDAGGGEEQGSVSDLFKKLLEGYSAEDRAQTGAPAQEGDEDWEVDFQDEDKGLTGRAS